jgi:hypothetical protein
MIFSADRCAAIASPLRYTQLVTRRRIAGFYSTLWCMSVGTVLGAFLISSVTTLDGSSTTRSIVSDYSNIPMSSLLQPNLVLTTTEDNRNSNNINVNDEQSGGANGGGIMPPHATSFTGNFPTTTNMIIDIGRSSADNEREVYASDVMNTSYIIEVQTDSDPSDVRNYSMGVGPPSPFQYRQMIGVCLPKMYGLSVSSVMWMSCWALLILVAPMITLLICDFTVLSIARKQRHRIVMALYQITTVTQVTVTGTKGTALPSLWLNRSVPARSRACRAVWEDMGTLLFLHLPLILILVRST